ncbi:hypothetical protein BDZ97DRAFT_1242356 [Flammula alnicola]|nr:hypothetical protein BDZ97DRAFT_1242356 [Flammula alnicola]
MDLLHLHLSTRQDHTFLLELTKEWLSRSGQLPLSLRLTASSTLLDAGFQDFYAEESNYFEFESLYIGPRLGQRVRNMQILHLKSTPRLQNLHISHTYLVCLRLQRGGITHIYASILSPTECLEILRRTPQLMSCIFPGVVPSNNMSTYPPAVTLSSLKFLELGGGPFVTLTPLFSKLLLPVLEIYTYNGRHTQFETDALVSLLARSGC